MKKPTIIKFIALLILIIALITTLYLYLETKTKYDNITKSVGEIDHLNERINELNNQIDELSNEPIIRLSDRRIDVTGYFFAEVQEVKNNRIIRVREITEINGGIYEDEKNLIIDDATLIAYKGEIINISDINPGDKILVFYSDKGLELISPQPIHEVAIVQIVSK